MPGEPSSLSMCACTKSKAASNPGTNGSPTTGTAWGCPGTQIVSRVSFLHSETLRPRNSPHPSQSRGPLRCQPPHLTQHWLCVLQLLILLKAPAAGGAAFGHVLSDFHCFSWIWDHWRWARNVFPHFRSLWMGLGFALSPINKFTSWLTLGQGKGFVGVSFPYFCTCITVSLQFRMKS